MKKLANVITISRIAFSLLLFFYPVFSYKFFLFYLLAGLSDIFDGYIARLTNSCSEFGSKLDSISDFVFFVICFTKFYSVLNLKLWMIIWIICILILKVISALRSRKLVVHHSIINKILGLLLFILPFLLNVINVDVYLVVLCLIATISVVRDLKEKAK